MILEKRLGVSLFLICQIQAKSDIAKYKNCDMIKHIGKLHIILSFKKRSGDISLQQYFMMSYKIE